MYTMRDVATGAEQQRTVAYFKEGDAAFFVDCFRSRAAGDAPQWHDYYYHNFGDTLELNGETAPTDIINFSESGLYALSFIKDKQMREGEGDFVADFRWKRPEGEVATRVFMNGAKGRSFVKGFAPPTEGLSRVKSPDYAITHESRTPVLIARQQGEAWDTPFIAVIDPSGQIAKVEFAANGAIAVQVKRSNILSAG